MRSTTGPPTDRRMSMTSPWDAPPTTAASDRADGEPGNAETAGPNGHHRHISTRANHASTTTTTHRTTCFPRMTASSSPSAVRRCFTVRIQLLQCFWENRGGMRFLVGVAAALGGALALAGPAMAEPGESADSVIGDLKSQGYNVVINWLNGYDTVPLAACTVQDVNNPNAE